MELHAMERGTNKTPERSKNKPNHMLHMHLTVIVVKNNNDRCTNKGRSNSTMTPFFRQTMSIKINFITWEHPVDLISTVPETINKM